MKEAFPLIRGLTKLTDKIVTNGFLASLKDVTAAVRKAWKPGAGMPMILGFLRADEPKRIAYIPIGYEREFAREFNIALLCRSQVRLGAVEVLSVQEAWLKDDRDKRVGEMVMIHCQSKDDIVSGLLEVATGATSKYLKPAVFTTEMTLANPVFNPWSTNEELCEHWGIPPELEAELTNALDQGVEDFLRQCEEQVGKPPPLEELAEYVGCNVDELAFGTKS